MSLADSAYFLPLVEVLLTAKDEDAARAQTDDLGMPRATSFRLLRFLRFHRALAPHGLSVADKRKLVMLAAGLRADKAVPTFVVPRIQGPAQVSGALERDGIAHALGFAAAANAIGYFEPSGVVSVYVPPSERRRAIAALRRIPGPERGHLYVDEAAVATSVRVAPHLRVTSNARTLIDLHSDPNGGAHAVFLEDVFRAQGLL